MNYKHYNPRQAALDAARGLLQNAAGSYLSLTTTAMSLLDAARSRLDEAAS